MFYYFIEYKKTPTMLKQLNLKKQTTLTQTKRQQWTLPNQHIKVIILLGLIRKVIRSTTRLIKQKQEKQNIQLSILHNFDFIAPVNKNIEQVKNTREVFVQLKKEILLFLRELKITALKEKSERVKKSEDAFVSQSTEQPHILLMKKTYPDFKDDSFITTVPLQKNIFTEIVDLNKSIYDKEFIEGNQKSTMKRKRGSQNFQNRKFIINGKMLEERMKNQSIVFDRFNKTLAGFCQTADSNTASKGCLELFQLFLRSIFEAKNCAAGKLSSIVHQKQDTRQRVNYLINSLINLSKTIFLLCKNMASSSKEIVKKIQDLEQSHQNLFTEEEESDKKNIVSLFIKRMNFMIEITKLMMSMSAIGYQKHKVKDKLISNLLGKLSEFRYTARYLSTEVMNIKEKKKSCDNLKNSYCRERREPSNDIFQIKWRKIYDRKFGRLQTSHGSITLRR